MIQYHGIIISVTNVDAETVKLSQILKPGFAVQALNDNVSCLPANNPLENHFAPELQPNFFFLFMKHIFEKQYFIILYLQSLVINFTPTFINNFMVTTGLNSYLYF